MGQRKYGRRISVIVEHPYRGVKVFFKWSEDVKRWFRLNDEELEAFLAEHHRYNRHWDIICYASEAEAVE